MVELAASSYVGHRVGLLLDKPHFQTLQHRQQECRQRFGEVTFGDLLLASWHTLPVVIVLNEYPPSHSTWQTSKALDPC